MKQILNFLKNNQSLIMTAATVIMALMSIFSVKSIYQNGLLIKLNEKAINLTRDSLAFQKDTFQVQNRPYLVVDLGTLRANPIEGESDKQQCIIDAYIQNIADVPATSVLIKATIFTNNIIGGETDLPLNTIIKGTRYTSWIYLSEQQYEMIFNGRNKIEVKMVVSYKGLKNTKYGFFIDYQLSPMKGNNKNINVTYSIENYK